MFHLYKSFVPSFRGNVKKARLQSMVTTLLLLCIFVQMHSENPTAFAQNPNSNQGASKYQRILSSKTIRCGYFLWPPFMWKDFNTGKFHGFIYDYVEKAASRLGLTITWSAEVVYGNIYQEIQANRIDAFCSGIWPTSGLGMLLNFTTPISYNPVVAFVRVNDQRFDADATKINSPSVTVVSMEGSIAEVIAKERFPLAKLIDTPQMSGPAAQLMDVVSKKADVAFVDWLLANEFLKNNPNTIKAVPNIKPINVWGNALAFGKSDQELVNAFNTVTNEMLYSGEIDEIIDRYNIFPAAIYRVDKPYKVNQ